MDILWDGHEWLTPRQVSDRLKRDLAYTTVMTVLARLETQGILERRRRSRSYEYRARLSREDFYADRLADVLGGSADTASTLARFVEQLTDTQRRELAERLGRTPQGEADSRGS